MAEAEQRHGEAVLAPAFLTAAKLALEAPEELTEVSQVGVVCVCAGPPSPLYSSASWLQAPSQPCCSALCRDMPAASTLAGPAAHTAQFYGSSMAITPPHTHAARAFARMCVCVRALTTPPCMAARACT